MVIRGHFILTWLVWIALVAAALIAPFEQQWNVLFVAVLALGLTFMPLVFARRFNIRLPVSFSAIIAVFLFASLFLGEAGDFYYRYWWWDTALHLGSAIGLGLIGFIIVFMLFEGDRYAAPPAAIAVLSFCFALALGALWEIFEFAMDQIFGMNMQKRGYYPESGLHDTMSDLIADAIGAAIGAFAGYRYMQRKTLFKLTLLIDQFVQLNSGHFRRLRDRRPK